jgi:adenine deaminase
MEARDKLPIERLLNVGRGVEPADIVLEGGMVVDVLSGTVRHADVAILGDCIAGVSPEGYEGHRVIDCTGAFIAPGLVDGHIHIESSLLAPWTFAHAVAQRGTTTVVADPHEIANVCGLAGVRFMTDVARGAPCDVFLAAPSCVPATDLDTAGAKLGAAEIAEMCAWPGVVALGEMMNYAGVLAGDPEVLAKLAAAAGKPIDGHAPGLTGLDLQAYVAAGPDSDHECTSLHEAREKLAAGMWTMVREGSAARNLCDLLPLAADPQTAGRCLFVSDDLAAHELLEEGHMDRILRRAVVAGLDHVTAVRLATLSPATRFRLHDRGAVRPGLLADLVVFEDLRQFVPRVVLKTGRETGEFDPTPPSVPAPTGTCRVGPLSEGSFVVPATGERARVIGIVPGQIVTQALWMSLPRADGQLQPAAEEDVAKVAVIERHGRGGGVGVGFVRGLGLKRGAIASTVSHDSHNLIVAGVDDRAMLAAARALIAAGGGFAAAHGEGNVQVLPLPIAGLMSDRPLQAVAAAHGELVRGAEAQGCSADPFPALSFLALPVIPELRITDRGLVDVTRFAHVSLTGD